MEKQALKGSNEAIVLRTGEGDKFKDKLCYGGGSGEVGGGSTYAELLSSWPPRHYTCSFCKRRFKSAQALGGHMNVHRRARAMLRSQSISPISSPPSSPWFPNSNAAADHPFQHDDHYHFIYPNPNPRWPLYTHHHTVKTSPSSLPHLCSLVTITHKNSSVLRAACNREHVLKADRYHHAELRTRERVKKNCIRAENRFKGLGSRSTSWFHQDDMISRLSLGTGPNMSRPAAEEDIDLELRLGY